MSPQFAADISVGRIPFKSCFAMKLSYLLAVSANRLVGLILLLALSHILSGSEFGSYLIMAINTLLIHTLAGNWLAMAAVQSLATTGQASDQPAILAKILKVGGCMVILQCAFAALMLTLSATTDIGIGVDHILATLSFSLALLAFDVATSAKNALGDDGNYLRFSLIRNVSGAVLSLIFASFTGDAVITLSGQVLGIVLAFAVSAPALQRWRLGVAALQSTALYRRDWLKMLAFGITGTLALGFIVLINSLIRNSALLAYGPEAAGVYGLVTDLLTAPLALLGTSYSLSKMRQLYQLGYVSEAERLKRHRRFFAATGLFTIPYATGGLIFAPALVTLVTPNTMHPLAGEIATYISLQSAFYALIAAAVTLLLTSGNKRLTVVAVTICVLFATCSSLAVIYRTGEYELAIWNLVGIGSALLICFLLVGIKSIPWADFVISMILSIMSAVIILLLQFWIQVENLIFLLPIAIVINCVLIWTFQRESCLELLPILAAKNLMLESEKNEEAT